MKKIIFIITLLVFTFAACAQQVSKTNITIEKIAPVLYLNGTSASINFYNNDIILQQSSNLLTLSGGNFSLGSNSLLGTGSIGTTSSRLTKGWFTDLEITNLPTINGGTLSSALSLSSYLLKSDTASMLTNYALLSEVSGGSMVYPTGSGIPLVVNGTSWGTTIANNSTNWNTAYNWGDHSSAGYATPQDINDTMDVYLDNATLGVALADSNIYNGGYVTRAFAESIIYDGPSNIDVDSITSTTVGYSVYKNGEALPPYIPDGYSDNPYDIFPEIHAFAGDTSNYATPDKIGDLFINTATSKVYVSVSTSRGGWVILNMILLLFYYIRRRRK